MLCSKNQITRYCSVMQRRIHISPVLRQLHWLPVHHRIKFEMAVLVYKSLHGLAPQYLKTVNASQVPTVVSFDRRTLLFHVPTLISATGHFQLLDHGCGTAFRPTYDSQTLPFSTQQFCQELKMYLFGGLRLQHLATFCL